jgi:hypothetical protein
MAMKEQPTRRQVLFFSLAMVLVLAFFVSPILFIPKEKKSSPEVWVGVDASFASVVDTEKLIDTVKSYTNLFVVGSTAITWNQSYLNQVCQYLNDSDMRFLTFGHPGADQFFSGKNWVRQAEQLWGTNFMGLYAYDEPGGHQIDHDTFFMCAPQATNYSEAAAKFVQNLTYYLGLVKYGWETDELPLFTSDYALQEYAYRGGYDAVFTEFGWNGSNPQLSIALCRGAATVHNRDWGVMITGSLNGSQLEAGEQMYLDMISAYDNGAKYIIVFDYPSLRGGILQQEHFDAIRQFWEYAQQHPRIEASSFGRVAYVVPKDYGFGFRSASDKIWGLWNADNQSSTVWIGVQNALGQYGSKLDVVYEDCLQLNVSAYRQFVFWNGTSINS